MIIMMRQEWLKQTVPAIVGVVLAGCGQVAELRPSTTSIEPGITLSGTAALNHHILLTKDSSIHVCMAPPPDAVLNQEEEGDFSFMTFGGGEEAAAEEEGTTEGEMLGRTPAVLVTREIFYRLCELSRNYQLSKEEVLTLYRTALDGIVKVWSVEASHTTVTIGETLKSTETATAIQQAPGLPPLPPPPAAPSPAALPAQSSDNGMPAGSVPSPDADADADADEE